MRKRMLCLWACLLLLALPARAATRVAPKDGGMADRLDEALRRMDAQAVGRYGMTPVCAGDIADGTYAVEVESSSPFFRIVEASLTVSGDALRADITLGSLSYGRVFMGAAADAERAADAWIDGAADGSRTVFTIPVPALNVPFDCAAYSVNRDRWYDRTLLIDASSLPESALAYALPDYALIERAIRAYSPAGAEPAEPGDVTDGGAAPVPVDLPDGEYAIEVNLAGGSGRASVSSPTLLIVREGRAWARLLWSSPYYDYMTVGGATYENLADGGGNSTFEIPVTAMDAAMPVVADTTAMGDPVEIAYQLTFYADTVGDKRQVPQEAAKQVLVIGLAVIVLGGALNHFVKKKRK